MRNYVSEYGPDENVSISFKDDQFGDVELLGTFMHMRDIRQNWWEGIGPGGTITGRIVVSDACVYFGACDNVFYCLDMYGKVKWTFKTTGVLLEGPAVSNDTVFFGSSDKNFYALDKKTGQEKWRYGAKGEIMDMPLYHEGRVYFGCMDNKLHCLDADTGKEIWYFATRDMPVSVPLIVDNRIYCGYGDQNFYCLDMDGNIVWKFAAKNTVSAWPASCLDDRLFFGSWDCNLYCLDMSGNLLWKMPASHPVMAPKVHDGKVYVGSWDNNVYCVDPATGRVIWKTDIKGIASGAISVKDCRVFAGSSDNNIYALNAKTGKVVWKFPTNGFVAQNSVFGNRVYNGCWDCNLYCLDFDGNLVWKFQTSMSTPSKINPPERFVAKTAEIVWQNESEKDKNGAEDEVTITDYGEFSGAYIDTTKTDYLGLKKKGYVK